MVQISWIGRNKSYTICHFCNSTSFPGGWPLHPLRGLFWRSSILLNKVQVYPLSIPTHSSRDEALLLGGIPPGRIPSHQSGLKKAFTDSLLTCIPLLLGKPSSMLPAAGSGQVSGTQQSVPDRRGRRSNFPKRGTATTVVEFLGQQVWKPIWSAGIFTRLENKPE